MAKFSGVIGYQYETETAPGVWKTEFLEKPARGDILRKDHRWSPQQYSTISTDSASEKISIGADSFFIELLRKKKLRYVKYEGDDTRYSIMEASVDRPRIVLSIGGVFNG